MRRIPQILGLLVLVLVAVSAITWLVAWATAPKPGHVLDEALRAGRDAASFRAADENYFKQMDRGIHLTPAEIRGRDTFLVWTGGNDRFWDRLATLSFGSFDLLKTLSSYPTLKVNRDNRWAVLGVVNEPCFEKATAPNPARYGLWLDVRKKNCPSDPFENEQKYPGVAIGARGKNIPVGSEYGYASGVVGLRIFPNPAFDENAAKAWDPVKYYTDPSYYDNKNLIRPYRVGMSCGFCHVGPSPVNPPSDPNNPTWASLSSTVGAQYMWADRIFSWRSDPSNFFTQLFTTWRPGTLDTSLTATDNINDPRTMNAVYNVEPRLVQGLRLAHEQLAGGGLDNPQINDFIKSGAFTRFYKAPKDVWVPHVLKDGSDSVGMLGALNRVYINIGTFSEEWLLHFNPIVGGKPVTPISISVSRTNSAFYAATEHQTINEALFLLRASRNLDHLRDAPGGSKYLTTDQQVLTRGKIVFAENCARCHSSKLPDSPLPGLDSSDCIGPQYLDCFKKYWAWTETPTFKAQMRRIVLAPDFLNNNFLSTDVRVPVTLLRTNACSPLASNATAGNIWDNYSSESYKQLPSVGTITWYDPYTGQPHQYRMPAGGRGYTRPASLIALWSTAPYLLNNSVGGPFDVSPSVDARMKLFQESIHEMLWPETRLHDTVNERRIPGHIDRTTVRSYLKVPRGYLPDAAPVGFLRRIFPWVFGSDNDPGLEIGPIPAGTPVDLIANIRMGAEDLTGSDRLDYQKNAAVLIPRLVGDLSRLSNATDEQARMTFENIYPNLLALSKCPDFVANRGHYFGTSGDAVANKEPSEPGLVLGPGLSDQDKRALIEFLKTF
jgi:hypothetical protein